MRKLLIAFVVAAFAAGGVVPAAARAADEAPETPAWFEGEIIDLADGWGEAGACAVLDSGTYCYRTEAEMDKQLAGWGIVAGGSSSRAAGGMSTMSLSCGSYLRLYDGTSFTGSSLLLNTRGVVMSLSTYSFDNKTSSYKVGGCTSVFYSGAAGSGSVYPGDTTAWAQDTAMLSGWNNVVSSVYIS